MRELVWHPRGSSDASYLQDSLGAAFMASNCLTNFRCVPTDMAGGACASEKDVIRSSPRAQGSNRGMTTLGARRQSESVEVSWWHTKRRQDKRAKLTDAQNRAGRWKAGT